MIARFIVNVEYTYTYNLFNITMVVKTTESIKYSLCEIKDFLTHFPHFLMIKLII